MSDSFREADGPQPGPDGSGPAPAGASSADSNDRGSEPASETSAESDDHGPTPVSESSADPNDRGPEPDPLGVLALESQALERIGTAENTEELEELRVSYLGRRSGSISRAMRTLGKLTPRERASAGKAANQAKGSVKAALEARAAELTRSGGSRTVSASDTSRPVASGPWGTTTDLTLPGRRQWRGGIHPVVRTVHEICAIFRDLGFTRARGPEADTEWYNFEALNTPLDHPAADAQDTLYLEGDYLLRSHTSPVQMRVLEAHRPPVRIVAPGWVYRRDTYDATHTPAFMQIEGLAVDEGITFIDFKATLAEFARRYWGPDTGIRFRPSFFPFTEPSAEVDVKRVLGRDDGSRYETDWLEVMGAGMVDPAVIANAGLDPERYTGFAFGMGPGRIAMLKYGVTDLRHFFECDVRFLASLFPGGGL